MRGAVLAGGAASRFDGKPKGLERVGGERIADRAIMVVQAAVGKPPTIVADAPEAKDWFPGMDIIADIHKECGALGGLHAAVAHDEEPVLVVGWDMPFLNSVLLDLLVQGLGTADACVPASNGPAGLEPLCGAYSHGCAGAVEAALEAEDYRLSGFLEQINVVTVPLAFVEEAGDPDMLFFNVNTPDELIQAEEQWRGQHG